MIALRQGGSVCVGVVMQLIAWENLVKAGDFGVFREACKIKVRVGTFHVLCT